MTFLLVFLLIIFVVIAVVITIIKESRQTEEPHQPIHFDSLDDNGNTMKEPTIQELQYFCIKDKGYHVSVWPKDAGMQNIDYIEFNIAGMSHRENIGSYLGEHIGTLEPEPTNPYDANAIKILAPDGNHVGYVPKDMTTRVREFTTQPCKCYFYIGNYFDAEGIHYYSDAYIKR